MFPNGKCTLRLSPTQRNEPDMSAPRTLTLYTRPDCALCDEARELVEREAPGVHLQAVNVDDDMDLLRRYGDHVPVLVQEGLPDAGELRWPFDADGLAEFLS